MINLLDNSEKKRIRRHYSVRLGIASLFLITILFIVGSIFLIPSLFLISVKEKEVLKQSIIAEKVLVLHGGGNVSDITKSTNRKISIFLTPEKDINPTSIIQAIIDKMVDSITVEGFFLQKEGVEDRRGKVIIRGNSRNRESLISFVGRLRESEFFESVDLPTSNLVKSRNINFSITIFLLEP